MLNYREALAQMASLPRWDSSERLTLHESRGRVLAEDLIARVPSPPFTNSAVDGYALRAEDAERGPWKVGAIWHAGVHAQECAASMAPPGVCFKVMTGAPLPSWADTVIPVEATQLASDGRILSLLPFKKGQNVRVLGEDLPVGAPLLRRGVVLDPERLMVAAAFGYANLKVYALPKISICTTGDELVELGEALPFGGVYNSNRYFLQAAAEGMGLSPTIHQIRDDKVKAASLVSSLTAADEAHLFITTGAVSAGDADFIPSLASDLGFSLCFHHVAVRPGRPVFVASRGNVIWLGLPGNPLATCTGWYYFARPILQQAAGIPAPRKRCLTLANPVDKPDHLRCFYRATVEDSMVTVAPKQGSAQFTASIYSTAYVELPEGSSHVPASTSVEAIIV